VHST
jgi:hypothetical protein